MEGWANGGVALASPLLRARRHGPISDGSSRVSLLQSGQSRCRDLLHGLRLPLVAQGVRPLSGDQRPQRRALLSMRHGVRCWHRIAGGRGACRVRAAAGDSADSVGAGSARQRGKRARGAHQGSRTPCTRARRSAGVRDPCPMAASNCAAQAAQHCIVDRHGAFGSRDRRLSRLRSLVRDAGRIELRARTSVAAGTGAGTGTLGTRKLGLRRCRHAGRFRACRDRGTRRAADTDSVERATTRSHLHRTSGPEREPRCSGTGCLRRCACRSRVVQPADRATRRKRRR